MDLTVESNALRDLLPTVNTVLILLPETSSRDAIAAGLALYLSLTQLQKIVTIVYPKPPLVALSHLVGLNKLTQKVGSRNFVISLDYVDGSIEKVSYHIEGNKFNLVIEPRGEHVFDEKKVTYSQSGATADLIITLEAASPQTLGAVYSENQSLFTAKPVVVIDHRTTNTQYGKINVVRPSASLSEVVAHLLKTLELPIDSDIASNLYDGVAVGSRNFSLREVNADTFEAAAWLLRAGARKYQSPPVGGQPFPSPFPRPTPLATQLPTPEELPHEEHAISSDPEVSPPPSGTPPPDWLKPKIYKGSQLL